MAIPKGKCCSTVVLPDFGAGTHPLPIPDATAWTITYKIGSTTISSVSFTSEDNPVTAASVQAKINADPVYIASGTTITVNSLDGNGLSVTICKKTTKKITNNAEGIFSVTLS